MKRLLFLICLILGLGLSASAQTVALMPIPKPSFYGQNGLPLAGCKIFTYITGTSTPLGTFTDSTGTIPNPNPVTCDAGGFVNPGIWLIVGDTYRILVQDQFGVQQYLVDGVVGVGGGTLSLFSTPNTWTALQTFSAGASINGGNLTGTFTGSPFFSGTPQFTFFTISNPTVIPNLNAQLWNGTSASAGGALTNGWVPVVSGAAASTWGPITTGILPGAGITTINGTPCTIGSSCTTGSALVVYSTASASTNASIGTTTMFTVGASNANFRFNWFGSISAVGASCTAASTLAFNLTFQDPNAVGSSTLIFNSASIVPGGTLNGVLGPLFYTAGSLLNSIEIPVTFRAKASTVIQYSTTYTAGTNCAPGPQYIFNPVLEQLTAN
jgi:hypothetical protein